ncbi:MAG TPA: glutamate mutase L [Ktedonobacterales bacterium]|nr:glutamate mutase L [Ktedonobacterales bacterium]
MADATRVTGRPQEGAMRRPPAIRSLILIDCGSAFTTAALVGLVDEQPRMLARAQRPTTSAPPIADIMVGARDAIAEIERVTGRALLRDGQLISPEQPDGAGVDSMTLVTSVGGPLRVFAAGPGRETLAALLYRSLAGLFSQIEPLPALDGPPYDAQALQSIANVRALAPHVILVVGPAFGASRGAQSLDATAQTILQWFQALREPARVDDPPITPPAIVFTGQQEDAAQLQTALQASATSVQVTQALSPSTLSPLNRAIGPIYESAALRPLPGYDRLRRLAAAPPMAAITSLGGVACFLAQRYAMNVVVADVGASSTVLAGATAEGEFVPGAQPVMGVGPGAGQLLRAVGAENVIRWLPFELDENSLREYVLRRMLRPHALPGSAIELEIEHALAREAMRMALRAPGSRLSGLRPVDVALATGGVLANTPTPAHAALILLDTLPLQGITSLAQDSARIASLLGMAGVLAPEFAGHIAEIDALATPLGPVVTTSGAAPTGEVAVYATLEYADGHKLAVEAVQGELSRLPLGQGERALFSLQPHASVDIGLGPGQPARATEPIEGGALGLVIDARGRPLPLAAGRDERIAQARAWRRALGIGEQAAQGDQA